MSYIPPIFILERFSEKLRKNSCFFSEKQMWFVCEVLMYSACLTPRHLPPLNVVNDILRKDQCNVNIQYCHKSDLPFEEEKNYYQISWEGGWPDNERVGPVVNSSFPFNARPTENLSSTHLLLNYLIVASETRSLLGLPGIISSLEFLWELMQLLKGLNLIEI